MSFYSLILFFHITGALGLFAGLGLEWLIVHNFSRATTSSAAMQWTGIFKVLPPVFSVSGLFILSSGIYMAVENWGMNSWVITGLVLFIFLTIFGSAIVGKKVKVLVEELKSESDKLSDIFIKKINSPVITRSLEVRTLLALSIVFMMTIKPGWSVTIIAVGIAVVAGFLLTRILK